MVDYSESRLLEWFASPFVDDGLFIERLGGSKSGSEAMRRYLALPDRIPSGGVAFF
jgi:hypothetical protein